MFVKQLPYHCQQLVVTNIDLGYTNARENLALLGDPVALIRATNPDLRTGRRRS